MNRVLAVVALVAVNNLIGCGGGGGGSSSSTGNYAGTWDVSTVRVINDCALPLPTTLVTTPVVNQDGTRIVVDAGSVVLTGATNNEDGFSVTSTSSPDANGCVTGTAFNFRNASDGNADVGIALLVRCPSAGNRECLVGYGGTGVRRNNRSVDARSADNLIPEIQANLAEAVLSGSGEVGTASEADGAGELAELVVPVE